jgi:PAS domain S-box-containing protein
MAPPGPSPPGPDPVRPYRLLFALIAVGNVAFALAHRLEGAATADPLWLRLAVSGPAAALALATFRVRFVRRHARALLYGAAYGLVGVSTVVCVWNGFAPSYALGYLALVAGLGLGGAITSERTSAVEGVMVAATLLPIVGFAFTPVPGVGWAALALSLVTTAGVAVAVARERARVAALRAGEEARYRSVFERATDGIYLADAATRRVLDANPAMLRLTGYALGAIRRLRIDDLIDVAPGERTVEENVALAQDIREMVVGPRRIRTGSGHLVDTEVSATVIDIGDGADTICVVVRDATERRKTERALREAASDAETARARAEELLRLKASLLANMSHEIRTPLTGILGYADLLADEVTGEAREMVDTIARSADRLHRTLNSVLDLARLDADNGPLDGRPVDLAAEAAAAVAALLPLACARGLTLTAEATAPSIWARAEPGAVARVLDNLVGNAIKFTVAGGVTVAVTSDGERATMTVRDTGPGIPEAFQPVLFDEFRQASTGHARTHEGAGLGLAITKRLVDRLGGTITVESEAGHGTAFAVALPASPPPVPAGRQAAVAAV